jgi:hypothetical protein
MRQPAASARARYELLYLHLGVGPVTSTTIATIVATIVSYLGSRGVQLLRAGPRVRQTGGLHRAERRHRANGRGQRQPQSDGHHQGRDVAERRGAAHALPYSVATACRRLALAARVAALTSASLRCRRPVPDVLRDARRRESRLQHASGPSGEVVPGGGSPREAWGRRRRTGRLRPA